ncbi:unnamed protein product [Peniophora sp. CBMAI 1063]|nr:unnamed protein product [Peniophora sp. CBMAI 1063]
MSYDLSAAFNAAQPVTRVMSIPELFSTIAHFALDIYMPLEPDRTRSNIGPGVYTLGAAVAISHVCATWESIQRALSGDLRNLIELHLENVFWGSLEAVHPPHEAYALELPQVVDLRLYNVSSSLLVAIKAPRLEDLYIAHMTVSIASIYEILRHSPLLETVSLDDCEYVTLDVGALDQPGASLGSDVGALDQPGASLGSPFELPELRLLDLFDSQFRDTAPRCFEQILEMLSSDPIDLAVSLQVGWTEKLVSLCLHHTHRHLVPNILFIAEDLQFYRLPVVPPSPFSPDMVDTKAGHAILAYPDLDWIFAELPRLDLHEQLSNITFLETNTCVVDYGGDVRSSLRTLMCALRNVETYWVNNYLRSPSDSDWHDDSRLNSCDCLWKCLIPATSGNDKRLPLPRLHNLGLRVTARISTDPLEEVCEVLKIRGEHGLSKLESLSFPFIPYPQSNNTVGALARSVSWAPITSHAAAVPAGDQGHS